MLYHSLKIKFHEDPKFASAEEIIHNSGGTDVECLIIDKIALRLLGHIYSNGYYIDYTSDLADIIARDLKGYKVFKSSIDKIINALILVEFIDSTMYKQHKILTSRGIQNRWAAYITKMRWESRIDPKFDLMQIDSNESYHKWVRNEDFTVYQAYSNHQRGKKRGSNVIQSTSGEHSDTKKGSNVIQSTSGEHSDAKKGSNVIQSTSGAGITPKKGSECTSIKGINSNSTSTITNTPTPPISESQDFSLEEQPSLSGSASSPPTPPSSNPKEEYSLFDPVEACEIYFTSQRWSKTKEQVAMTRMPMYDPKKEPPLVTLRAWADLFNSYLLMGKGNPQRTVLEWSDHFFRWLNTMPTTKKTPAQFLAEKDTQNEKPPKNATTHRQSNLNSSQPPRSAETKIDGSKFGRGY